MGKRNLFCVIVLLICLSWNLKAEAAPVYTVTEEDGILTCTGDGQVMTNVSFAIKNTNGIYSVVKPGTSNSVIYYFDRNGIGTVYNKNSFVKITYKGKAYTYYLRYGKIVKNCITGNKKQGYYYVDKYGVRSTSKEIKLAVNFVRKYTKSSWSKSKKLSTCYKKLWKNYKYQRFYDKPSAKKMPSYAKYMLTKKKGNCFRYAASFAYIATVIGYDSRVTCGSISSTRGGMTPHGWTEVKKDGKWYLCDANMQRNFPSVNSYLRTERTYPYRHKSSKKYKITVKYGKVSWK